MRNAAPGIPKSAATLALGDYAMLRREDGRYVPLVFLASVAHKRVVFYGGLLAFVSSEPKLSEQGPELKVVDVAMIDIDAFAEADAPIVGNVCERLNKADIEARVAGMRVHSRVWGRKTPLNYANELAV